MDKIAVEETNQSQTPEEQQHIEVLEAETDVEDRSFRNRSKKKTALEPDERLISRMIMDEFLVGILEPDPTREPHPLFQLHRYSSDMLLKLLRCTRELEHIVGDEITTRNRRLIDISPEKD